MSGKIVGVKPDVLILPSGRDCKQLFPVFAWHPISKRRTRATKTISGCEMHRQDATLGHLLEMKHFLSGRGGSEHVETI